MGYRRLCVLLVVISVIEYSQGKRRFPGHGRGFFRGPQRGQGQKGSSGGLSHLLKSLLGLVGGNRPATPGTGPGGGRPNLSSERLPSCGQGVCFKRFQQRRITLAERGEAASTGLISRISIFFQQNFFNHCLFSDRKYRTIDGACNNLRNLGAAFKPVARVFPPDYDDGVSSPRETGVWGRPLPSAREVSRRVCPHVNGALDFTLMVMQWGQFVDHDLSALPVIQTEGKCCGENNSYPFFDTNRDCFPIKVSPDDPDFQGTCMEFVRSAPSLDLRGREKIPREQINSLTAFLDASQIYGSDEETAQYLREPNTPYLRTKKEGYMPESEVEDCITRPDTEDYCFLAGDLRVNEQPGLAVIHTIWLREHNRIARELQTLRPDLPSEEIFQSTREIIGVNPLSPTTPPSPPTPALLQHITYNEWLPVLLGEDAERYFLTSTTGRSPYFSAIDPRIFNAFATAIFRIGHTMIPDDFIIGKKKIGLHTMFERTESVLTSLDDVILGLVAMTSPEIAPLPRVDRNFAGSIANRLFEPSGMPGKGLDLVSLNIQRGRDHGLPAYNKWRSYCRLPPLRDFDDIDNAGNVANILKEVYDDVNDIDLYIGIVLEKPITRSGLLGPTTSCLLAKQFRNLKYGDRYFFSHYRSRFSDEQLSAIRKTTLSAIFCQNSNISRIRHNVFTLRDNPVLDCSEILNSDRMLNLELFV